MDRRTFYHGQVVNESEMDEAFDDVQHMEYALAIDGHHRQVSAADSPDSTVFGGIVKGLVVTGTPGDDYVSVVLGVVRDNLGRRVDLTEAATIKITHTGTTPTADVSDALGNAAAISGSCSAGNRIVVSLFLAYAELASDPRVDATGATVYYDVAESFCFDLQIGTQFAHPPGSTPSRAALADGKVLLADIVLTNSGGNMQVVAVCTDDQDWDDLTGNYANCAGRRSDWLSLDQGADFPQNDAAGISIREPGSRQAIHTLVKHLQRQTSGAGAPAGAELIGGVVRAGTRNCQAEYQGLSLTAGNLDDQILAILTELNKKAGRGPDLHQAFHDHFMYTPQGAGYSFVPNADSPWWGTIYSGGVGSLVLQQGPTGVLRLVTDSSAGRTMGIQTGVGPTNTVGWWVTNAAPFPVAAFKLAPVDTTDLYIYFGLIGAAVGCRVQGVIDMDGSHPSLTGGVGLYVTDGAAAGGTYSSQVLAQPNVGQWWEYYVEVISNTQARLRVVTNSTVWVSDAVTPGGTGNFGTGNWCAFCYAESRSGGGGAAVSVDLDAVAVGYSGTVPAPT